METFEQNDWIQNFRMSKETFLYLCDIIMIHNFGGLSVLRRDLQLHFGVSLLQLSTEQLHISLGSLDHLCVQLFMRHVVLLSEY